MRIRGVEDQNNEDRFIWIGLEGDFGIVFAPKCFRVWNKESRVFITNGT